jgi:hypothetical protein
MANTFKSYTKASVGAVLTDVYTVPGATTATVIGFALANRTGSGTVYADVIVNKSSGDDVYIIRNASLYDGSGFEFNAGNKIVLETGDKIQVQSDTSSSVDIIVSVLEQS